VCARSSSSFSDGFMNVWNLGWKLALVANGTAHAAVLDTYQAERQPVGRNVLPLTDRAFAIATSTGPAGPIRANPGRHATRPVRRPVPGRPGRRAAGPPYHLPTGHRLQRQPRSPRRPPQVAAARAAGGRPSARRPAPKSMAVPRPCTGSAPRRVSELLLTSVTDEWHSDHVDPLAAQHPGLIDVHRLSRQPGPGVLHDTGGDAHRRLALAVRSERQSLFRLGHRNNPWIGWAVGVSAAAQLATIYVRASTTPSAPRPSPPAAPRRAPLVDHRVRRRRDRKGYPPTRQRPRRHDARRTACLHGVGDLRPNLGFSARASRTPHPPSTR
jgi:hypothetical protein